MQITPPGRMALPHLTVLPALPPPSRRADRDRKRPSFTVNPDGTTEPDGDLGREDLGRKDLRRLGDALSSPLAAPFAALAQFLPRYRLQAHSPAYSPAQSLASAIHRLPPEIAFEVQRYVQEQLGDGLYYEPWTRAVLAYLRHSGSDR